MHKMTIRFSVPTLPDLTPQGIRRMFFASGHSLAEAAYTRRKQAQDAADYAYQQSLGEYCTVHSQLAGMTVDDLEITARNCCATVAGQELQASDGFPILEWAILDAEYRRLNLDDLVARLNSAEKKRRTAESRMYYWQVLRDRA